MDEGERTLEISDGIRKGKSNEDNECLESYLVTNN